MSKKKALTSVTALSLLATSLPVYATPVEESQTPTPENGVTETQQDGAVQASPTTTTVEGNTVPQVETTSVDGGFPAVQENVDSTEDGNNAGEVKSTTTGDEAPTVDEVPVEDEVPKVDEEPEADTETDSADAKDKQEQPKAEDEEKTKENKDTPQPAEIIEAKGTPSALGLADLEVDINFALPLANKASDISGMVVTLKDSSNNAYPVHLSNGDGLLEINGATVHYEIKKLDKTKSEVVSDTDKVNYYSIMFSDLPSDNYNLSVIGEGYASVEGIQVDLQEFSKRVTVNNKENFLVGDVNADGQVTDADYDELIQNIKATDKETIKKYDLNKDDVVNIVDLSYIQENLNKTPSEVLVAKTAPVVKTSNITIGVSETAGISAEDLPTALENLMTGNAPVAVTVSADQPASLGMSFEESVTMDKIDIAIPNSEQSPSAGYVLVEDEEGNETKIYYGTDAYLNEQSTVETTGSVNKPMLKMARSLNKPMLSAIASLDTPVLFANEMKANATSDEGMTYSDSQESELQSNTSPQDDTEGTLENTVKPNSSIVIDLKNQIAVKKITIVITDTTAKDAKLAQIGKVEFLNNVYEKIPEPIMNIPTIKNVVEGAEEVTVKWDAEPNVDGYELRLTGMIKGKEVTKVIQTTKTQFTFTGLENYQPYKVAIQSLNGDWVSGYSAETEATPKPTGIPEAPEGVKVNGLYQSLSVSWSKHKNADTFHLYYKPVGSTEEPKVIKNIKQLNYTITGLENDTEYEVYLIAENKHGLSVASKVYKGSTINLDAPITPNYKLINVTSEIGQPTAHIKNVTYPSGGSGDNKFVIVDGDYTSQWVYKSWDGGGFNAGKPSPVVEFDEAYELDTIVVTPAVSQKYNYTYVKVRVNVDGQMVEKPASLYTKKDKNDKVYYEVRLNEPVTTDKVQVNFALSLAYGDGTVSISDMKFYLYDSLEDDVRSLFEDDLLVALKEDVTLEKIAELRQRANETDSVSGEYHPYRDAIVREIDYAEQLYKDSQVGSSEVMIVNENITNTGNNLGMSNDNQALGLSARAGDTLTVYVGSEGVVPQLVFTQFYGESGAYQSTVNLKKGRNVITVPKITGMDVEKGGNIYVRYPSASPTNGDVKIRVMGATKIPHLNLYGLINDESKQAEVKQLIREYITELEQHVANIGDLYTAEVNPSENKYAYDERTSVMNTTDIELDKATFNVAATAILEGLKGDSLDAKVNQLYDSLKAMEQLMDLKYAERGVVKNPDLDGNGKIEGTEATIAYPKSRANIKYQRMFIGAFMYAGSNHVGIEYGSIGGLTGGKPFEFNEDGSVAKQGQLFGWGIWHEIGHMMDMPSIGTAEVTNNIIALLAQTIDDTSPSRLESSNKYKDIYEKVTSNTIALPSDVFVQLGMYWQLHLAYDKERTSLMLKTNVDGTTTNDTIYAKMSKLLRNLTAEEKALPKEQLLVRVASDAVGKDLSDFFYSWGIRPSEETKSYLASKGYEKETHKIQYLNDNAHRKVVVDKVAEMAKETKATVSLNQEIPENSVINSKDITLNLGVTQDKDKILGYEVSRNGQVVGFTTDETFTDSLGSINNRVVTYSVKAIDYHLNETEVFTLDPIKVSHDGTMDKKGWSVETNMTSTEDVTDEHNNHGHFENPSVEKVIDGEDSHVFTGTKPSKSDGEIIIDMNSTQPIVGIRYKKASDNPIKGYEIYVSTDKKDWVLANSGTFTFADGKDEETVYFNQEGSEGGKQLCSYTAGYVKIIAKGTNTVSVAELDVIAPPGDNIEIGTRDAVYTDGIGVLETAYKYGEGENEVIPEGSFIITGSYRGHPAFNASVLRDQDGYMVSTETIFLAELPKNAVLGEISEGTYITWVTPTEYEKVKDKLTKVKTELYRVDDALTLNGQRLVSDTLYIDVPSKLTNINFTDSKSATSAKKVSVLQIEKGVDVSDNVPQVN